MLAADNGPDPGRGPTHDTHAADQTNGLVPDEDAFRPRPGRLWLLALFMAFLGGVGGWIAGDEVTHVVHWTARPRPRGPERQVHPDATGFRLLLVSREEAERRNTSLAMGILGGILGLAAGVGGGLARNTSLAVLRGGLGGLGVGAFAGAFVPWMLVPEFYRFLNRAPNPMLPVVMHACVYASIGGAMGLAFGYGLLGRRGAAKGFITGAMGAVLGSVLFAVLHALLFPMEWDFSPMPGNTLSRLLAHVCVAELSVTCVTVALGAEARRTAFERAAAFPERDGSLSGDVQR